MAPSSNGPDVAGRLAPGPGAFDPWQAAQAIWEVWWAGRADASEITRLAAHRLRALLAAACAAPLQARRLATAAGVAASDAKRLASRVSRLPLSEIPPIGRACMMEGFDEACTDPALTLAATRAFLADPSRLGEAFLGRYAVWTSSGTTTAPGIWVHDARALAVYDALDAVRFCGLEAPGPGIPLADPWLNPLQVTARRFAMVGATGGHFAGNASIERQRRIWPWAALHARCFTIMQPVAHLVAELADFDPTVLATYPTAAELLAAECRAGRLRIRPREIWVGGEQLSEAVRREVEQTFGCRVRQGYGASECLSIAWECSRGTLHLNADWVLLEPVDRQLRPVPPGSAAHTVLLTNLANHVQPVIRYDLGDNVTVLTKPCACGSAFPAIRIEGRRDDVLQFDVGAGPVRLLPLALVTVMEEDADTFDFQLIGRDPRTLALRLPDGDDVRSRRRTCHQALRRCLDAHGLRGVRIVDEPQAPTREPVSGKLRRVLNAAPR